MNALQQYGEFPLTQNCRGAAPEVEGIEDLKLFPVQRYFLLNGSQPCGDRGKALNGVKVAVEAF
jgi:hypothetical protein